jgi:hypothetical protein
MITENETDIVKLLDFVRKHQTYKSDALISIPLHYKSISDWIEEENISKGSYAVRASKLLNSYKSWCKNNKIEKSDVAKSRAFHSTLKQVFNYNNNKGSNNLFYYVNKKFKKEEKEKS